ncbi:MAG: MotA/TolQ/ExbB proton channel family protein [Pseudomonadota bacterium]
MSPNELSDKKPLFASGDTLPQSPVITQQSGDAQVIGSSAPNTDTALDTASAGLKLDQLQALIDAGGPVIMILIAMSVLALIVLLLKGWQFSWMGFNRYKIIDAALQHWHKSRADIALTLLRKTRNPIARVLEVAMSLKIQNADDLVAREEVTRLAKQQLAGARSYLKILEVIATLSPLLGLLGTVIGMISAFQNLQNAGSSIDPALLSGGIWEALLTTAAGLIVAIPAVIALNWLEQRVEQFTLVMEDTITQVFTSEACGLTVTEAVSAVAIAKAPARKSQALSIGEDDEATALAMASHLSATR